MRSALISLIMTCSLFSCKKEDSTDMNSFWHCHQSLNLDSTAVAARLVGSWTWDQRACYMTGKAESADKHLTVSFNTGGAFTIKEGKNTVVQGTWKVVPEDRELWGLELSEPSLYLYGRILFCDERVLFNDSYRDGCDNYFSRDK